MPPGTSTQVRERPALSRLALLSCAAAAAGCLSPFTEAPSTPPTREASPSLTARWEADTLRAGALSTLHVVLTAKEPTDGGAELRVGFPHWVYGANNVTRPPGTEPGRFGHWYLVRRLPPLAAGEELTLELGPLRLPESSGPGFHPLLLVDWSPLPLDDASLLPGPAERLRLLAPTTAAPGAELQLLLRVEDRHGNPLLVRRVPRRAPGTPGVVRFEAEHALADRTLTATANPTLVARSLPRVAWLDLHGHSGLSDGRGDAASYFAAAADAGLDGAALSDHDWQLTDPEWDRLLLAVEQANQPGAFVAFPAAETNLFGHEVVWFKSAASLRARSLGSRGGARTVWQETDLGRPAAQAPPLQLLPGVERLAAPHTTLAASMGTRFPLPAGAPPMSLFEVYSAHGSSEHRSAARQVLSGNDPQTSSLWDALDAGLAPRLMAAGDSHDGRPGRSAWGPWPGGLTAVALQGPMNREAVWQALAEGSMWASTGERVLLQARWEADSVVLRVVGDGALAAEVVGDREVLARRDHPPQGEWSILPLPSSRWRYARLLLEGGGRAWVGVNRGVGARPLRAREDE